MKFAKWVFLISGIYGVILLFSMFFLEGQYGRDYPPEVNHPELYYGFVGAVFFCQLIYLLVSTDPIRYRILMLWGAAAKTCFFVTVVILHLQSRVASGIVGVAAPDLIMAVLFVIAWLHMPKA